jgi:hypothetical protein
MRYLFITLCCFSMALLLPIQSASAATDDAQLLGEIKPSPPKVVSSNDNYIGDCIKPLSKISNSPLLGGREYKVTNQKKANDDVQLTLLETNGNAMRCHVDNFNQSPMTEKLSNLVDAGFERTGWVYGVLTLPYKFYTTDKSMTSNATVGPYLGRRSTLLGLSYTWAFSLGLTQVSGNALDANGKSVLDANGVAKQTPLAALTVAGGLIFDINKGAAGSAPFTAGVFYGQDRVGDDNAAAYSRSGQPWFAVQLGYSFVNN